VLTMAGHNLPTLSGSLPLVIAHRGASGYLPEHTLAAYALAIEQGADFIEPDLVATQDGVLIARHEPNLIETTNVQDLPQFADRRRSVMIDGRPHTGFFCHDFTLLEIKELRVRQPRPYRDQSYNDQFPIPTFSEILDLVQQMEATRGRRIGIYPETKHPTYFDQLGRSLEEPLLHTLIEHAFIDPQRVFIQSFEVANLRELRTLMAAQELNLPLVQLFGEWQQQPYDFVLSGDSRTYGDLIAAHLQFVASYAAAIGVEKRSIVRTTPATHSAQAGILEEHQTGEVLPIVRAAHAAGLQVHVYTFRNEAEFLAREYENQPEAEYRQFYQLGVDGVFSDFPDTAVAAREHLTGTSELDSELDAVG